MNWELLIAGIALLLSSFSIFFTIYKSHRAEKAEIENYRYQIMYSIKELWFKINSKIIKLEIIIDNLDIKDGNVEGFNNRKEGQLSPFKLILEEVDKLAREITDYKKCKDIICIRKIALSFITAKGRYKLIEREFEKVLS